MTDRQVFNTSSTSDHHFSEPNLAVVKMCHQITEVFAACRYIYYIHLYQWIHEKLSKQLNI
jgi:hypothetical protein